MAANMKEVKLRIKSVENTMQITRAMELVASSKLRGAKERAETCRPYFQELYETLREIAAGNTDFSSVYAAPSGGGKMLLCADRRRTGDWREGTTPTCSGAWRRPRETGTIPCFPSGRKRWNTCAAGNWTA